MSMASDHDLAISRWLIICLILIFAMAVLDSLKRIPASQQPILPQNASVSLLPPLSDADWRHEFSHYRQSPRYLKLSREMGLAEYKFLFLLSYAQRMLGPLLGFVFIIPFIYFCWRDRLDPGLTRKLNLMFTLGVLQGLLGWYMLRGGPVEKVQLYHYWLSAYLLIIVSIYGYMLWAIFGLRDRQSYMPMHFSELTLWRIGSLVLTTLVLITIVSGGFVSGLGAGSMYNSFPLMDGQLIPDGLDAMSPWYMNLFENRLTVQFHHRILAVATALVLIAWYLARDRLLHEPVIKTSFKLVGMMVVIQMLLGIATLLLQIPAWLGVMHWAGALLLFGAMLFNVHSLSRL